MKILLSKRDPIIQKSIIETKEAFETNLRKMIGKHGDDSFASVQEMHGALSEELLGVLQSIQGNDIQSVRDKLLDVAVVAFWGVASIDQKLERNGKNR